MNIVVPHAGTWIEIGFTSVLSGMGTVVPHAGTWIEIQRPQRLPAVSESFPTRERGLKFVPLRRSAAWASRSPRGNVD